jgi:hypothetical protein
MQGELAIPEPEYGHPHATNNGACIHDVPGPTNSLPLRPCSGALTAAPRISTAQTAGTGWGICSRTRLQTRHRHGAPVRAQHGTPDHARAQHNEARPHRDLSTEVQTPVRNNHCGKGWGICLFTPSQACCTRLRTMRHASICNGAPVLNEAPTSESSLRG